MQIKIRWMNEINNNSKNLVKIIGNILSCFTFSHEVFGEKFYKVELEINRLSGQADIIPLMVSERLINVTENYIGYIVEVVGQFRSYNFYKDTTHSLILYTFVKEIKFMEEFHEYTKNNQIYLDGYIFKLPIYRKTPLGREVSDLLVAVKRPYGKSDYIPCIAWGRNARFAAEFEVGFHLEIEGRIQSREYKKNISELKSEIRIAYEVSITRLEVIVDDKA